MFAVEHTIVLKELNGNTEYRREFELFEENLKYGKRT